MRAPRVAYPLTWRIMDVLEWLAAKVWPPGFQKGVPYLMLMPAIVLVGLLVLGLFQIGDAIAKVIDIPHLAPLEQWKRKSRLSHYCHRRTP